MATVFVIGAGPSGLFAAQKIALAGHETVIFNRDIKPGGLAEYGIYPHKHKMKAGVRKQFEKVLALPNIHYFGNVPIGTTCPVSIEASIAAVGQDIARVPNETFSCLLKYPAPPVTLPRLTFRFLSSPLAIVPGVDGRTARIILSENALLNRNGDVVARSTDKTSELEIDTMIFAIGDMHDFRLVQTDT